MKAYKIYFEGGFSRIFICESIFTLRRFSKFKKYRKIRKDWKEIKMWDLEENDLLAV